jgi:catechol 2,3-dioxygenase-like lactoylglutathione lyase family enzyme
MKAWTVPALFLLFLTRGASNESPLAGKLDGTPTAPATQPALAHTCLISGDVKRLAAFYEKVLQIEPQRSGDDYLEFRTNEGTLALFSTAAQEKYIRGAATGGGNRGVILEFRVSNVDGEYARLQGLVNVWVKGPTTQPWGTRSIYFRDPDGNLVDFFMPAARVTQTQ